MEKVLVDSNLLQDLVSEVKKIGNSMKKLTENTDIKDKKYEKEYLTVKEAREYSGNSDSWFRTRIKNGTIQSRREGVKLLEVKKSDIDKLIKK